MSIELPVDTSLLQVFTGSLQTPTADGATADVSVTIWLFRIIFGMAGVVSCYTRNTLH